MANILQELITQLESQVPLKPLIEAKGIALKQEGNTWVGRCPYHADTGLSLAINPTSNRWECRGGCQSNGTVVDWVMKAEGVSHRHAMELLRNNLPVSATSPSQQPVKSSTVRRLDAPFGSGDDDPTVLKRVVGYYHETLKQNPEALEYLTKHGLGSAEAIDKFQLGYANRTLGYRLPQKNRIEGGALRGQLQRLGILRSSGHEHFHGALVIPVIDEIGLIVDLYGRRIGKSKDGVPVDLYLPGPSKGLWNLDALKAHKEIILCHGLIDALTFWCAGYRNVTALHGADGLTPERLELLKRYKVECLLIAYGNTEADNAAASALAERLLAEGFGCFRIVFQTGLDASGCAQQSKQPAKQLGALIRRATWLGKGKVPSMPVTTSTSDDLEPPAVVLTETVVAEATTLCVSEQPSCEQEPPRPDTASVEPEIIVAPSLNDLLLQDGPDEEPPALPATVMPEAAAPEPPPRPGMTRS